MEEAAISIPWSEFGLAGVIFAGMVALIRWLVVIMREEWKETRGQLDRIADRHDATSREIAEGHNRTVIAIRKAHEDERAEWRADARQREDRMAQMTSETLGAIKEARGGV